MYKNDRQGIIDEYTDKFADEDVGRREDYRGQRSLKKHTVRGLVSDIVDRVVKDPTRFSFKKPIAPMELIGKIQSVLENKAPVTDSFRLDEIDRILNDE